MQSGTSLSTSKTEYYKTLPSKIEIDSSFRFYFSGPFQHTKIDNNKWLLQKNLNMIFI